MNSIQQRLVNSLYSLADTDQIAEVLGIKDLESQTEEFWEGQRRAVKNRFYFYCLHNLGLPLSLEIEDLEIDDLLNVSAYAESLVENPEFSYAPVRNWFRHYGQFATNQITKHRREVRDLETRVLRVLFVFDKGAKYLKYENNIPVMAATSAEAFTFKVNSLTETSKEYLVEMAKHFEALAEEVGATQVKILSGRA